MDTALKCITKAAVQRAIEADPNSQRCLVENCSRTQAVQIAHVFDREASTKSEIMDALEWNWGLAKGTLNLDTRRNVFFLGASLYEMYKDMRWGLLPEKDVFLQYFHGKTWMMFPRERHELPYIEADTFNYTFIPLRDMDDIYITRKCTNDAETRSITVHHYPYNQLPIITSHIHPKYVIMHLGNILHNDLDSSTNDLLVEKYPWLSELIDLIILWKSMSGGASRDPIYVPRRPDPSKSCSSVPQSDNSRHTLPRRIQDSRPNLARPKYQTTSSSSSDATTTSASDSQSSDYSSRRDSTSNEKHASARHTRTSSEFEQHGDMRFLTARALRDQEKREDLESVNWTTGRILVWTKACASTPTAAPALPIGSKAKRQVRKSTRLKSRMKKP